MKVLFLDFDGVLNSKAWWESPERAAMTKHSLHGNSLRNLDPAAVARLQRIVEVTDCRIVISSAWRSYYGRNRSGGITKLRDMLTKRGLRNARRVVIGCTPDLQGRTASGVYVGKARGHEIREWMNGREVRKFAVADDERHDMAEWPELVRTSFEVGLTDADTERVIALLS